MPSNRLPIIPLFAGAALVAGAAHAGVLYDNGPSTYQAVSFGISQGNYAEDSFTIGANATVTGVDFVAWNSPTYAPTTTVDWAIFSMLKIPYGSNGTEIASGTAEVTSSYILTNTSGYAVNTDTFAIAPTALASGTYALALYNALDTTLDVYPNIRWDVNFGPSAGFARTNFGPFESYGASNTFQILGTVAAVPEPANWALMLAGFAGLGGALRRARHRPAAA
jgi:hypothetical protein